MTPRPAPRQAPVTNQPPVTNVQAPAPAAAKPAPASPMAEAEEAGQSPVQLTADQIVHDRELGIVAAKGRVEIVQEGRTLVADSVSYNLKQDIVSASGNVSLTEPTGEVAFSDYFELTGDLKEGIAKEIRVILADNSRMAGASAHRVGGDRTDIDKGVYTACEPCRNKPDSKPLWEAKAQRITHNQADQLIEYRDAWIELAGIPVAYTPYLSHPDPTVKRKSGFLVPTAGMSSNLGPNVTVPYFFAIKDNQDFTFAPRFVFPNSSKKRDDLSQANDNVLQSVVLAGEHRWVGREGETRTVGSLTEDKYSGDMRGHVDARGRFDLNRSWRAGYQVERSSDDTYTSLYSYRIQNERPWLTTRPYVERFGRRSYVQAEGFAFQGLRQQDDPGQSPIVLPHVSTSHMGMPGAKGGYWSLDNDMLAYARSEGTGATRLSSTAGWHRPFMGSMGDITTVSATMRADAYHAERVANEGTGNAGRAVPQVSADWRMPFVRDSATMPQVLEPVAMIAASPNGGNPAKIPNEDSIGFELDELNVFRPNRLPGLDRVEGGLRGAYGLKWHAYPSMGTIGATVAQGWRQHADSTFRRDAGFNEQLSDYLGRVDFSPSNNLQLLNRVRLDKDSGELRRNESTMSIGSPLLRTDISYLMIERSEDGTESFARRHYLAWQVQTALTRYWTALAGVSYDLTDAGGPLGWNTRLTYNDECFAFVTNLRQNYTHDRDYETGFNLTLNIVFKTLGDVPFNVF
ncbi:MAG: LPS-assembly protein LptD [Rhodospirillaceae bacterium]|nr:LPS-assembly protein LptD [Rhodospirillales bacterium]